MIPASIYDEDAREAQSRKDATPRATALLHDVHAAEYATNDLVTRKSLEAMHGALALHCSFKEDLSEVGEREYRKRLDLILGAK